jgi:hypothetical protein
MSKAKELKGVYNLNPTTMIMKQGSKESRMEHEKSMSGRYDGPRVPEAHEVGVDLEQEAHESSHPMMQTRHSHPKELKHADGRKHEDDHHAVRKLKGMK